MRRSPLIKTLSTFTVREHTECYRWVQSPAFNRRKEVIQLYDWVLEEFKKTEQANALLKSEACRMLRMDDLRLRHTMSFLFAVVKQFLAWKEWQGDPAATRLYLSRAARKKGLNELFQEKHPAASEAENEVQPQNADFQLHQYRLHFEQWEAAHRIGLPSQADLNAANQRFGLYVAISTLRHGCAVLDQGNAGATAEIFWLNQVLEAIGQGQFAQQPGVQVYYHCYLLMLKSKSHHYQLLKNLLMEHPNLLPRQELRDVYLVGINYCIKKLNAGEKEYIREALDLYRLGLERNAVQDNGGISKATYQNILLLALALEEWQWGRDFLEQYAGALPSGERHNTYHFNLALYFFRKKDYPAAQEILRRVDFRDVFYNLDARRMLLRIYFDQHAFQALDSLIHSFRIYLLRHRNIGYHRELNRNFVHAVQHLTRLLPGDVAGRKKLRQRILSEKYVAEREWILSHLSD